MPTTQIRPRLEAALKGDGPAALLTITEQTFGTRKIQSLLRRFYPAGSIVIEGARIAPAEPGAGGAVVVTGASSFLNVVAAPVTASFNSAGKEVELCLKYRLPPSWQFSQSFRDLPVSTDFSSGGGSPRRPYLDRLHFTDASFVVCTSAHTDPDFGAPVVAGLNFLSRLTPNGTLGAADYFIGGGRPVVVYGPILLPPFDADEAAADSPRLRPGINLRSDLGLDLQLGTAKLDTAALKFYSPTGAEAAAQVATPAPGIFFDAALQISPRISLNLRAEIHLGAAAALTLRGAFGGLSLPSLSELAGLVGGDDLAAQIPPEFAAVGSLSLEEVVLGLTSGDPVLNFVSLTVGLNGVGWSAVEGFIEMDDLSVTFLVTDPLRRGRQLSATIIGALDIGGVRLSAVCAIPGFLLTAELTPGQPLSLNSLMRKFAPDVPRVADKGLAVRQLVLSAQPKQSFGVGTLMAEGTLWELDLGVKTLRVGGAQLQLSYNKGTGVGGVLSGQLTLAGVALTVSYKFPGPFVLGGELPPVSFRQLVGELCGGPVPLPDGFDLALSKSLLRIEKQAAGYKLAAGAVAEDFGVVALTVARAAGRWGFAAGVALPDAWKLSKIHDALAVFDETFRFSKMILVLSSINDPAFTFPDPSAFGEPAVAAAPITLPASSGGVVPGVSLYAQMVFGGDRGVDFLKRVLNLNQATLDVMIQVGQPPVNTTLMASVSGRFNEDITFTGALRVALRPGELGVSLLGTVGLTVQRQPLAITAQLDVTPNGAVVAGTMRGSWVNAFDIPALTLSDLALEMGINWQLVPTAGITASLALGEFNGSVAVLFDSTMPSNSLLAGSLGDLTAEDVYRAFVTVANLPAQVPPELGFALRGLTLKGNPLFGLPPGLAAELDAGVVTPALSQAFFAGGKINLPANSRDMLLRVGQPGRLWYLTDRTTLKHYRVEARGARLQVSLDVQLYLAPQATAIGQLRFPQGTRLSAALDCFGVGGSVLVEVSPGVGIVLDGSLEPVRVGEFFQLTGRGGEGGPVVSAATFSAPGAKYPGPHCVLSGSATLLGFTRDIELRASRDGFTFTTSAKLFDAFRAVLSAQAPLREFARNDFSVAAVMEQDLHDFLNTRGADALRRAASEAVKKLSAAEAQAAAMQRPVDALNAQISAKTTEILAERARAEKKLREAEGEVASIEATIRRHKRKVDDLEDDIDDLKKEIKKNPAKAPGNGLKITKKGTEIAGLKVTIRSKRAALEAAEGVLKTARKAVAKTPVESDPRVGGLYTQLAAARTARDGARAALAEVRRSIGNLDAVAGWLLSHGTRQLLDVTRAEFSGALGRVSGGRVAMALGLTFMGRPQRVGFDFNFRDLEESVANLVAELKKLTSV